MLVLAAVACSATGALPLRTGGPLTDNVTESHYAVAEHSHLGRRMALRIVSDEYGKGTVNMMLSDLEICFCSDIRHWNPIGLHVILTVLCSMHHLQDPHCINSVCCGTLLY